MYEISCACKKSKKSFKMEIGSFFVNDCCEKAGYDEFGKTKEDYKKEAAEIVQDVLQNVQSAPQAIAQVIEEVMDEEYSDEPIIEEPKSSEMPELKSIDELKNYSVRELQDYLSSQNIPFKKGERNKDKLLALVK